MQTRQTWQEAGDFCSMLVNFEVAKRMTPYDVQHRVGDAELEP